MSGCRGRPKTSGRSHNKRANTYTSTRTNKDNDISKKMKSSTTPLMTNFFKSVNI